MRRRRWGLMAGLATILASTGGASAQQVPDAIAAPGTTPMMTLHAEGALIYQCTNGNAGNVWQQRDFAAVLLQDGKNVGRHYSPGPIWQLADSSTVKAKVDVRLPASDKANPDWLKLTITEHSGSGRLDAATAIQRVNTQNGALSGACDRAGDEKILPYAADYIFLKPS